MSWWSWLIPGRKRSSQTAQATSSATTPLRIEPVDDTVLPQSGTTQSHSVLPWLLDCPALTDTPITEIEATALDAIERTLAQPEIPDNLLPRATALIPQLIALLRQTELPTPAIAQRIGQDAVLAAEVMRLASSPYYRLQATVNDLDQAIQLIGLHGLQTVIARVLLKPIYRTAPGPLSGRAGPRMWDHSEALARHTAILSGPAGLPVFDAYLTGMLHDTGWTVAFSIIDRAAMPAPLPVPPSQAFGAALTEHSHRLFGLAAQRWDITPGFSALAQDARRNGLAAATHPLARLLHQAQGQCLNELASG